MSSITRRKGQSGKTVVVQCIHCGKRIPKDKAVEKTRTTLPIDYRTRMLLKKSGAQLSHAKIKVYYCISCAKHRKYV
ncbi:MAG: 30S ribosomal protein S26e [Promethearchaeota archaeon]